MASKVPDCSSAEERSGNWLVGYIPAELLVPGNQCWQQLYQRAMFNRIYSCSCSDCRSINSLPLLSSAELAMGKVVYMLSFCLPNTPYPDFFNNCAVWNDGVHLCSIPLVPASVVQQGVARENSCQQEHQENHRCESSAIPVKTENNEQQNDSQSQELDKSEQEQCNKKEQQKDGCQHEDEEAPNSQEKEHPPQDKDKQAPQSAEKNEEPLQEKDEEAVQSPEINGQPMQEKGAEAPQPVEENEHIQQEAIEVGHVSLDAIRHFQRQRTEQFQQHQQYIWLMQYQLWYREYVQRQYLAHRQTVIGYQQPQQNWYYLQSHNNREQPPYRNAEPYQVGNNHPYAHYNHRPQQNGMNQPWMVEDSDEPASPARSPSRRRRHHRSQHLCQRCQRMERRERELSARSTSPDSGVSSCSN